jgi:hypothetical protein
MKDREPRLTIIDELNKSLKDEAIENMDIPTVQSIAESIGIDETTLYSWLHNDAQFAAALHNVKRLKEITEDILRKFPDLAWTDEEKEIIGEDIEMKAQAIQIFFIVAEAKERHHLIN